MACRKYACPACGRGRLIECRELITEGIRQGLGRGDRYAMVTLTWPADVGPRWGRDGLQAAARTWSRIMQGYRRSHVGRWEYARTPEMHRSGVVHSHAIVVGPWLQKCNDGGRQAHGLDVGRESGSPCYCEGSVAAATCRRGAACRYAADHARPCLQAIATRHGAGWVDISGPRQRGGGHGAMMAAASYATKYILKSTTPMVAPADRLPGESPEMAEAPAAVEHWPRYARRLSCSRRWGATMGSIHRAWVARVMAEHPPADPRTPVGWMRVDSPARRWAGTTIDLPPPVPVDPRTGELLPELLPVPL